MSKIYSIIKQISSRLNNFGGMKNTLKTVLAGLLIASSIIVLGGFALTSLTEGFESAGADIPTPVASFTTSLQSSISSSATTMTLTSFETDDGTDLTEGTIYGFTIDEGTANEEYVVGTATTSNQIINMSRGVSVITGNTEVTALKKAHRRGASVKITDAPVLLVLARIINGDESLPNLLTYTSTSTPTQATDLVHKQYVLDVVNGGAVTFDQTVIEATAGATVASGNLVYMDEADGEWKLVDTDVSGSVTDVSMGIAQGAGTDGNGISGGVLIQGIDKTTTYTAGQLYYATSTPGTLDTSAGSPQVLVGVGDAEGNLIFIHRNGRTSVSTDELAALAGTSGTPSASNKFVTDDDTTGTGAVVRESAVATTTYATGATTRAGNAASGDQTIAHGLSSTPDYVRVTVTNGSNNDAFIVSVGAYNGTTNSYASGGKESSDTNGGSSTQYATSNGGTSYIANLEKPQLTSDYQRATAAVDGTNITLSWTKGNNGVSGTMYIMWEAFAN